jgi:hypothetical protein
MFNCSQRDNQRAALRFEGTFNKLHSVSNSVAHEGLGWGLGVFSSANVNIINSSFINFKQVAVKVEASSSVNFNGIFAGDVMRRDF